jgi:chitodextrinase
MRGRVGVVGVAVVVVTIAVAGSSTAARSPRLTGVHVTGIAPTSVSVTWHQPHSGRAAVELFVDGRRIAVVRARRFTFATLTCATQYRLTLRARDGHGRRSGRTRLFLTTATCAGPDPGDADKGEAPPPLPDPLVPSPAAPPTAVDTQAPTAPGALAVGKVTTNAIPLTWAAATDDVGVSRYAVYLNGTQTLPPSPRATSYTFSGLMCGTQYTLGVQAFDPTGNASPIAATAASTSACPVAAPPPTASSCPSNPLQGVQRPGQLTVLDGSNPCRTVTGRVASHHVEHDGDCHVNVTVDAPYTGLLNGVNHSAAGGALIAEVIPSHPLGIPSTGSQVSVFGTWVNDHATGWNELHAVWSMQVLSGGSGSC